MILLHHPSHVLIIRLFPSNFLIANQGTPLLVLIKLLLICVHLYCLVYRCSIFLDFQLLSRYWCCSSSSEELQYCSYFYKVFILVISYCIVIVQIPSLFCQYTCIRLLNVIIMFNIYYLVLFQLTSFFQIICLVFSLTSEVSVLFFL